MEDVHYDVNIPVPEAPVENHSGGDTPASKKRKFQEVSHEEISGSKVLVLPNGVSPSNKLIKELIQLVKPKMKKLVEDANLVIAFRARLAD